MTGASRQPGTCWAASPAPGTTARRWLVLFYAVIAQCAGSLVYQGIYVLVPFLEADMRLTTSIASLMVMAVNGGQLLSLFPLGRAIDRHGEHLVVGIAMLLMGGACILAGVATGTYWQLLATTVLIGAAYGAVQPGGTRAIIRWFPPEQRGLATGLRQSSLPVGTLAAALLLPLLATQFGWRYALLAQGAASVLGGAVFLAFYREGRGAAPRTRQGGVPTVARLVSTLLERRESRLLFLSGMSMFAFQALAMAQTIPFLSARFGMAVTVAASLFSVSQVVGIPGRIVLPWIVDRFLQGRRNQFLGCLTCLSAGAMLVLVLLPVSTPPVLLSLAIIVLGLGLCWFPIYLLQIAEMAPEGAVAATVSLSSSCGMVAMALTPVAFGLIVDAASYQVAWAAGAFLLALPGIALLRAGDGAPKVKMRGVR